MVGMVRYVPPVPSLVGCCEPWSRLAGASASAYMLLYRSKADRVASTNLSPNGSPRSDAHEHAKSPSSMIMSTSEEGVAVSASRSRNTHLFVEGDVEGDDISARIDVSA